VGGERQVYVPRARKSAQAMAEKTAAAKAASAAAVSASNQGALKDGDDVTDDVTASIGLPLPCALEEP
jgi:hypothetical protein